MRDLKHEFWYMNEGMMDHSLGDLNLPSDVRI